MRFTFRSLKGLTQVQSVRSRRPPQRLLTTMSSNIGQDKSVKRPISGNPDEFEERIYKKAGDYPNEPDKDDILNEPSTSRKRIKSDDVDSANGQEIKKGLEPAIRLELRKFYEYNPSNKFELYDDCIERWRSQLKNREGIDHFYKYFDAEYYIDSQGLRRVYPYYFIYYAFCKRRWIGKTALEVCQHEFRALPPGKLEERFEKGLCRVNGLKTAPDYVLKDSDIITNLVHRHEPPVLGTPVKVIHEDGDLVAIDKPPSMPCHPCGKFRHNSVVSILSRECSIWPPGGLKLCHRLDRLTSGILVMAKNTEKAREIHRQVEGRNVEKEYICRVEGEFPEGEIICEQPLEAISFKFGIVWVSKDGKPCKTSFKRLNYNGTTSTVICKPHTGRMHQIRVHLQYLGHPITNDPVYNSDAFGPKKGKGGDYSGLSKEQITVRVSKLYPDPMEGDDGYSTDEKDQSQSETDLTKKDELVYESPPSPLRGKISDEKAIESLGHYTNTQEWAQLAMKYQYDPKKVTFDPDCVDCTRSFKATHPSDMLLYLHAFRYKGEGWDFKTDYPVWAKEDWED